MPFHSLLVFALAASAQTKMPAPANFKIDFEKHVQPILAAKCHSCHGSEVQQGGLRLDKRQNAFRGGDYGPVILPGKGAESKLVKRLVNGDGGLQMPPTGALPEEEIAILRAWIDQGADFRIEVHEEAPAKPVDPKFLSFLEKIRTQDLAAVKQILAAQPQWIEGKDKAGSTALHHAAAYGTLETMRFLLDKGANPNAANNRKSTPLFWALQDEAKVRLLLDKGASLTAQTSDGRSMIYQAASIEHSTAVLRLLLEKGANPNTKTLTGMTPLMAASTRANLDAMRVLIDKGADVKAKNAAGATALMAAAATGDTSAVRLLLDRGAEINPRTKRNETALANAATTGNAEIIKMLLDGGAEVNVADIRGYTALHYAAGSDTMPAAVVKMLLDKGADTTGKADGETAAMLAAKRGDSEVARLLNVSPATRARLGVVAPPRTPLPARSLADTVRPALALLEKQSHNFIRIGGCNSCHAQDLPSTAAAIARERGLPAPKSIAQLPLHMHATNTERMMDLNAVSVTTLGWELYDLHANRQPADEYTDSLIRYIRLMQTPAGNWTSFESRRPPMNTGMYQTAALAIYGLQNYGRTQDREQNMKAIARAAAWLERAKPATTQDRAFHLLGLAWAGAPSATIATAAKALAATQREDGGWSQLATMGSDAYASGQALFALNTAARMAVSDPVFRKGTDYLLRTQHADGSWQVATRSIWVQPYFESGFPHGHNQWISTAGTSWAVMALSLTQPQAVTRLNE
ncbi:MAG: ankyrin repeat domain-containing protein [Bryobacteraceae bacterium]